VTLSQSNPSLSPTTPAEGLRASTWRRIARHANDSKGLSMVEILVVILILGVLAAVAVPSLLSTRSHATDAQAVTLVQTAQTTAEALDSEQGNYNGVTRSAIAAQEPAVTIEASDQHAYLSEATHGEDEYSLTAKATNGDELTITRSSDGSVTRTCRSPVLKTGCSGGETSTW
jgi:type IV pilus assembly protein PilA